jgi:hypothetical protein
LIVCRTLEETWRILSAAAARCSRFVGEDEIGDAIRNARNDWRPSTRCTAGSSSKQILRWPVADWPAIARIAAQRTALADLWEASPIRMEGALTTCDFLSLMFPGNPLLCLAKSHPGDARTLPLNEWKTCNGGLGAHSLIVPSQMSAPTGRNKAGKVSPRSLDNTGPRRFLVIEFDFSAAGNDGKATPAAPLLEALARESPPRRPPDLCAAILLHFIARGAPLVLAVHSGGKSVHGYFLAHGATDAALRPFFAEACRLGADTATWTLCQMVRLPEGTRDDGRRQPVYYFNPALIPPA